MLPNELHVDPEELVLPGGTNEANTSKVKFRDKFHAWKNLQQPATID
jgi:hypothetical protein